MSDDEFADAVEATNSTSSKRIEALERNLANAESDRKQADTDTIRALHERNEAREQRDKLASAVRLLMDVIGPADDPAWADDDQVEAAWQAGLAALKGVES